MSRLSPRSVLITGASSGLGLALAINLVQQPASQVRHIAICGRDAAKLEDAKRRLVLAAVPGCAIIVLARVVDVRSADEMGKFIRDANDACPLDLVVANAGIATPTLNGGAKDLAALENPLKGMLTEMETARDIVEINLIGVINTALPAVEALRKGETRRTSLVIISSLSTLGIHLAAGAGHFGLRGALVYIATKHAVTTLADGLRAELRMGAPASPHWSKKDDSPSSAGQQLENGAQDDDVDDNARLREVTVTTVFPPFVATGMTRDHSTAFTRGMPVDKAAEVIARGVLRGREHVAFPTWQVLSLRAMNCCPRFCLGWCL